MNMQEPLNVTSDEHGPATPAAENDQPVQRNIVGRQLRIRHLVQAIIDQPGRRASDLASLINVPASTISQDISPLIDLGLVYKKPAKGGGASLFFFTHPSGDMISVNGSERGKKPFSFRAWLNG